MAQEFTSAQLAQMERIKQQQAQRFKAMGLPANAGKIADIPVEYIPEQRAYDMPTKVIQEVIQPQYDQTPQATNMTVSNSSNVAQQIAQQIAEERSQRQSAIYSAPRDKINALEAIRMGAKRQEFRTFMKADSSGINENQFSELKINKKKPLRPGQPYEKTSQPVQVQTFNAREISETKNLESMFTDGASGISMRSSGSGIPKGDLIQTGNDYSSVAPDYDPVYHLKRKAAEKGVNIDITKRQQSTPQVFQEGNFEQMSQMMLMMETLMKNQQKNYEISDLKQIMEGIAKKVAEDTMKKVLREYVDTQKKKNVFEMVNKEQNVIKIGESYYQLKKVVPKP